MSEEAELGISFPIFQCIKTFISPREDRKKAIIPKSLEMQERKTNKDRISLPKTGKKFPFIIATD
jgi:hypothetical protein